MYCANFVNLKIKTPGANVNLNLDLATPYDATYAYPEKLCMGFLTTFYGCFRIIRNNHTAH
jgi:hypothetical protein